MDEVPGTLVACVGGPFLVVEAAGDADEAALAEVLDAGGGETVPRLDVNEDRSVLASPIDGEAQGCDGVVGWGRRRFG